MPDKKSLLDYDKWLEILCLYILGVLLKVTGEKWEVVPDRSGHDFLFDLRLNGFHWQTRCYDFTDINLFERLLRDSIQIAYLYWRETSEAEPSTSEIKIKYWLVDEKERM